MRKKLRVGFLCFLCFLGRVIFSLRYKVKISSLKLPKEKGMLVLPNHTSRLDPIVLILYFWPRFQFRPVAVEYISRMPVVRLFMQLFRGLSIPNFDTSINHYKIWKAEERLKEISKGLEKGENFLLYPAGKLKKSGREVVGGSSGAHELLRTCPNACPVLVRQTGFWGSRFSHAFADNDSFSIKKIGKAIKGVCKSFIFFSPRRKIEIVLEACPSGLPVQGTRREFNRFLEKWYNQYTHSEGVCENEPYQWVPESLWDRKPPAERILEEKKKTPKVPVAPEIEREISNEIRQILNRPDLEIHSEQHLATDLGMDSIDIAKLLAFLSRHYHVQSLRFEQLQTVENVFVAAVEKPVSNSSISSQGSWGLERARPTPLPPTASTLPEALFDICGRMGSRIACADDLVGEISYRKFLRASLVLSNYFRQFPETNVGILLPASVGAFILIFSLMLAGKVPVILNWTLGPKALEQMVEAAGLKKIVSSWRFMERLNHVEFGTAVGKIELLEDIRATIGWPLILRGMWKAFWGLKRGIARENDIAAILFTSGSEGVPKGVPLTHRNILQNQHSLMGHIQFSRDDVLLSILPPFHSLGLSVVGIFPLLCGLKTAFFPNPTDPLALADAICRWRPTWLVSPSSFLKELFSIATKEQVETIRYIVSGGERTSKNLYKQFEALGLQAQFLEAYGTTECSPCICIGGKTGPQKGVGAILPGIEICTVDPETGRVRPTGTEGEICVCGENVFKGYLNGRANPFLQIEGKRWYRTGDLGRVDAERNLILSGRIKRFVKIGGEMISLAAVEEALTKGIFREGSGDRPELAICADEKLEERAQLILFCTMPITQKEVTEILKREGFSNLIRISAIFQVREIPVLGTGKIDYVTLINQANSNLAKRKSPSR